MAKWKLRRTLGNLSRRCFFGRFRCKNDNKCYNNNNINKMKCARLRSPVSNVGTSVNLFNSNSSRTKTSKIRSSSSTRKHYYY
jgi:hypothetical protein